MSFDVGHCVIKCQFAKFPAARSCLWRHQHPEYYEINSGSIPAGAGEPDLHSRCDLHSRVYPRGCGGARVIKEYLEPREGLSPRVRGSLNIRRNPARPRRSIPAGAGEPITNLRANLSQRVYPRGCGGASLDQRALVNPQGLSPRVRGSLGRQSSAVFLEGSIPAGAGEPRFDGDRFNGDRVYPRGCGGAR